MKISEENLNKLKKEDRILLNTERLLIENSFNFIYFLGYLEIILGTILFIGMSIMGVLLKSASIFSSGIIVGLFYFLIGSLTIIGSFIVTKLSYNKLNNKYFKIEVK